jgi:hypothetical protein
VAVVRNAGLNAEGGAVESVFVLLVLYRQEKVARFEPMPGSGRRRATPSSNAVPRAA